MRSHTLLPFALAALAGGMLALPPALAATGPEARLEVNENCVENHWPCWAAAGTGSKPSPAGRITIPAGGEVVFTDNTATNANIAWMGTAPACSPSVPVSPAEPRAGWEGRCKFELPGTYRFESSTLFNGGPAENYTQYEVVVEAGAGTTPSTTTTGTTGTGTSSPAMPSGPGSGHGSVGSPLAGGSRALALAGAQRGSTVRGSIKVSQAGDGGQLEVALFAAAASLSRERRPEQVRVGRLVRPSVKPGSVSFSVPLSAKGKASLRRHRHIALIVRVTLTPLHGAGVTLTRTIVVHV